MSLLKKVFPYIYAGTLYYYYFWNAFIGFFFLFVLNYVFIILMMPLFGVGLDDLDNVFNYIFIGGGGVLYIILLSLSIQFYSLFFNKDRSIYIRVPFQLFLVTVAMIALIIISFTILFFYWAIMSPNGILNSI